MWLALGEKAKPAGVIYSFAGSAINSAGVAVSKCKKNIPQRRFPVKINLACLFLNLMQAPNRPVHASEEAKTKQQQGENRIDRTNIRLLIKYFHMNFVHYF